MITILHTDKSILNLVKFKRIWIVRFFFTFPTELAPNEISFGAK